MNNTVFVIGSNSFSGASFSKYALEKGANVVGLSRSAPPNSCFLPYSWSRKNEKFQFHKLDLNKDLSQIIELVKTVKPNYIVNFAAQSMVAESWDFPEDWFLTNVLSTTLLFKELCLFKFIKKYVHVTTPEVYGSTDGFISEDAVFNPSTPYAVSRAAGDMSLNAYAKSYNFPAVSTRAANVYGPGQQLYRIIPRTILGIRTGKKLQLHGGGESTRSFIHIEDVSSATWKIMIDGCVGHTYHISNDNIVTIRSLVEMICEELAVDFEQNVELVGDRKGKDSAYLLDSTKLKVGLNWHSKIDLISGIRDTVGWVDNNFNQLKNSSLEYIHKK